MYHLDTPELIVKHIECLKRNTKPDLVLISSLAKKLIKKDIDNNINILIDRQIEKDNEERISCSNYLKAENKNQFPEFMSGLSYVEMVSEVILKELDDLEMGQIKDDVIFNHNQGEKDTMEYLKSIKVEPTEIEINSDDRFVTCKITPRTSKKDRKKIEEVQFLLKEDLWKVPEVINTDSVDKKENLWQEPQNGKKEIEGKLDYSEINLEILDLMAQRFSANKHKYPQGNMKKPIDKESLVWAAFRHIRKMLQPIEGDPETYREHLTAVLCNMSMLLDQENIK